MDISHHSGRYEEMFRLDIWGVLLHILLPSAKKNATGKPSLVFPGTMLVRRSIQRPWPFGLSEKAYQC